MASSHPFPFARHEPPKRDVIRARPIKRDPSGKHVISPGEFDTALIMEWLDRFGIYRKFPIYEIECSCSYLVCF